MNAKDSTASNEVGDFFASWPLLIWDWNGTVARTVGNAQHFAHEFEAFWGEIIAQHIQSSMAATALVAWSTQELFQSGGLLDLVAAEANILNTFARASFWPTFAWSEFAEKIQRHRVMTMGNADGVRNLAHFRWVVPRRADRPSRRFDVSAGRC